MKDIFATVGTVLSFRFILNHIYVYGLLENVIYFENILSELYTIEKQEIRKVMDLPNI